VTAPNSPGTDFGYTGQRQLDAGMGGLMDYKARFYSPYLNHFTQPDSIVPDPANSQSLNRYSYALNNPIRYNDPSGHCPICVGLVLVGAFFIFNGTSDSYQPNLSTAELESRQTSVELGVALVVTAYSIQAPIVEAISNTYDCATGYCDPSLMLPGSYSAYSNTASETRTLYHATDTAGANSILTNGIDVTKGRVDLDFNPAGQSGFYLTDDILQAKDWATSPKFRGNGTVLEFNVPVEKIKLLNGKIFTEAGEEWTDFVLAGRGGILHHEYDFVEGPVLKKSTGTGFGHQFALFTQNAANLFDKYIINGR